MIVLSHINHHPKKLSILMGLIFSLISFTTITKERAANQKSLYIGAIKSLPNDKFNVIYGGKTINLVDGCFSLKEQAAIDLNILFIDPEHICFCCEDNTVQNLSSKTEDYLFFECKPTQFIEPNDLKNSFSSAWQILAKKLDQQIIPLNTIIIPISPNYINIILQNTVTKSNDLTIKLPEIKITAKAKHNLRNLIIESYIKTIGLKPFHTKQQVYSICQNNTKVSIII